MPLSIALMGLRVARRRALVRTSGGAYASRAHDECGPAVGYQLLHTWSDRRNGTDRGDREHDASSLLLLPCSRTQRRPT